MSKLSKISIGNITIRPEEYYRAVTGDDRYIYIESIDSKGTVQITGTDRPSCNSLIGKESREVTLNQLKALICSGD